MYIEINVHNISKIAFFQICLYGLTSQTNGGQFNPPFHRSPSFQRPFNPHWHNQPQPQPPYRPRLPQPPQLNPYLRYPQFPQFPPFPFSLFPPALRYPFMFQQPHRGVINRVPQPTALSATQSHSPLPGYIPPVVNGVPSAVVVSQAGNPLAVTQSIVPVASVSLEPQTTKDAQNIIQNVLSGMLTIKKLCEVFINMSFFLFTSP